MILKFFQNLKQLIIILFILALVIFMIVLGLILKTISNKINEEQLQQNRRPFYVSPHSQRRRLLLSGY